MHYRSVTLYEADKHSLCRLNFRRTNRRRSRSFGRIKQANWQQTEHRDEQKYVKSTTMVESPGKTSTSPPSTKNPHSAAKVKNYKKKKEPKHAFYCWR